MKKIDEKINKKIDEKINKKINAKINEIMNEKAMKIAKKIAMYTVNAHQNISIHLPARRYVMFYYHFIYETALEFFLKGFHIA